MTREYFAKQLRCGGEVDLKTTGHDIDLKLDFIKVALILTQDVWLPADVQLSSYLSAKLVETHSLGCWRFLGTVQPWHNVKTVDSSEFSSNKNVFSFKNISSLLTPTFPIFVKWLFE